MTTQKIVAYQSRSLLTNLTYKQVNTFLFIVFIWNTVFLPADNFNLKIISLLLLLAANFPIFFQATTKTEKVILFFGAILTSVTILWSIFLTKNLSNVNLGYPGYILLLYFIIKKYDINFYKIFMRILRILACFIVFMFLLDISHILDMNKNMLLMWFQTSGNAMIGKGEHLPIKYMIFFKTSPLFFIVLLEDLKRKKYIFAAISSIAIVLSGTRANLLCLICSLVVFFCFLCPNKRIRLISRVTCIGLGVLLFIDRRFIEYLIDMFQRKASSDAVRKGHLQGLFAFWRNNPLSFMIGSGYSSEFYSYGLGSMTSNIELSYWNLLRQVGLVLFIPMMIMYVYPLFKLLRKKQNYTVVFGYLVYLVIAYTNPFLYSSTGITLLLFMYYVAYKAKKERRYERNYTCGWVGNAVVPAHESNK